MPISFFKHCFFRGGSRSNPSLPIIGSEMGGSKLVPVDSGELQVLTVDSKVPSNLDEPVPVISELPSGHGESLLADSQELNRQNNQCHISEVFKFKFSELEEATSNFDPSRILGNGSYGTVYSGKLKDGRLVAIKRLREDRFKSLRLHDEKPESDKLQKFMSEVAALTCLMHENLVQLYGCTSPQTHEMLLVQEYVPNESVAHYLLRAGILPWSTRLNIAIQTASALAYLHASNIIHRDVKTRNILLDNSWNAKVADFGLSLLFPHGVTHVTTDPAGTPGYIDPEYYEHCHLSDKSDVYSFGVTLIELISSLPAFSEDEKQPFLSNFAVEKISSGKLQNLVDQNLGFESDDWITETVNAVAELAFRCLQSESKLRPSMAEVLIVLQGIRSGSSQSALT